MNLKWSSKFELKPGRWVFVPTPETVALGKKIKAAIEACWAPPATYYHLRAGGHVEALRSHLGHNSFARMDIQDFFGSINRSRITRCLRPRVGYAKAREWANASTVNDPENPERFIVPFGFVQSQIVASLCLWESALGVCLKKLTANTQCAVSVYVDDIIVSSSVDGLCEQAVSELSTAAERSNFTLSPDKKEGPAVAITAFNIVLANESIQITEDRLKQFIAALEQSTSEHQRAGIVSYVTSVNTVQGEALAKIVP